jgi:hypothetical protein
VKRPYRVVQIRYKIRETRRKSDAFPTHYFRQREIFLLEQGEREFERDVDATMRTVLGRGFSDPSDSLFIEDGKGFLGDSNAVRPLPDWLSEADLSCFSEAYRNSGFRGGLNWYRNIDRNWELTAPMRSMRP